MTVQIKMEIDGVLAKVGDGYKAITGKSLKMDLPSELDENLHSLMVTDAEIILKLVRDKPEVLNKMLEGVAKGNHKKVRKLALESGFDEEAIIKQGGGALIHGAIIVGIILFAWRAY